MWKKLKSLFDRSPSYAELEAALAVKDKELELLRIAIHEQQHKTHAWSNLVSSLIPHLKPGVGVYTGMNNYVLYPEADVLLADGRGGHLTVNYGTKVIFTPRAESVRIDYDCLEKTAADKSALPQSASGVLHFTGKTVTPESFEEYANQSIIIDDDYPVDAFNKIRFLYCTIYCQTFDHFDDCLFDSCRITALNNATNFGNNTVNACTAF